MNLRFVSVILGGTFFMAEYGQATDIIGWFTEPDSYPYKITVAQLYDLHEELDKEDRQGRVYILKPCGQESEKCQVVRVNENSNK